MKGNKNKYAKGGSVEERVFQTDKYGEVSVRNAMFDIDGTNLEEGIEIKGDDIELTEIMQYYDVDELNIEEVEKLLEKYEGNELSMNDEDDYYTEEYAKGGEVRKYKWVENIGSPNRRDLSEKEFDEVYQEYKCNPNWKFKLDAVDLGGVNAYNEKEDKHIAWSRKYDFSYAKGGSVEDKEYVLERYYVYVHKDSYEEGETDNVQHWDSSDYGEDNQVFSSKSDLMHFIKGVIERDTQDDDIREDYFNIESDDDETTIDYAVLCKNNYIHRIDNYEKATDEEKEQWKKGDLELFSVSFTFKVKVYEPRKKVEFAKGGRVYEITDIEYDTDDDSDLPKTLKIEVPSGYEGYEADEFISDKISDETGFTHLGYSTNPEIKYAKGGKVGEKGNEMLIGGLAGILLGIFLNK